MLETVPNLLFQIDVEQSVDQTLGDIIAFAPRLIAALIILLIGWIIGRILGGVVKRLVDTVKLDRKVLATPLGTAMGDTERAVSHSFGLIARWFIYALAILAAADVLAIALLSEWIAIAVSYLPAFVAGLLIIIFGFVIADYIGDTIMRSSLSVESTYTRWIASAIQVFLYFVVIVVGLDTMGIDVGILFVFARALAWGLAIAIALAVGIAFGLGGQDYVANNIERWTREGKSEVRDTDSGTSGSAGSGTGSDRPPE